MTQNIVLVPRPRKLTIRPGHFTGPPAESSFVRDSSIIDPQGYSVSISAGGITARHSAEAGAFYAQATLNQLRRQFPRSLPCLEIEDSPDFPVRGVMLDISRDKVPTMATLLELIDLLASWKINQLQLYMEHTFAYRNHRPVWANASPLTADEIRMLDSHCRSRFIELVPNQNSFGHMERWLVHRQYQHLAETMDGAETPWGFRWKGPFSLCPTDPASVEFLAGLYAELLPNFSSRLFNVGCDETFDIGQGRSKSECDRRGVMEVYLDYLNRVNDLVRSHGRRMMFWGDIIVKKPELLDRLPKDAIALEWGHEADHPFDHDGKIFAAAGVPFYVCPGTSSWNSFAGRTDNALANLRNAAKNGRQHGAIGYLITDWGDYGHLQYLPVSYLGFAAGAAFSWCLEANENLDVVSALNLHVFGNSIGQIAYDLGNVYQACGKPNPNGSTLFRIVVPPPSDPHSAAGLIAADLDRAERAIESAAAGLERFSGLVADEFRNAVAMLRHSTIIARGDPNPDLPKIVAEHRRLWLARNRPGGLEDSAARLTQSQKSSVRKPPPDCA